MIAGMDSDMHDIDCLIVGAGVVGLATARHLARAGRAVMVLERNAAFGEETSARNSEVIHAGIVYAEGSLKARTCVRGKHLLYDFCCERGVAHARCGKLVIATAIDQHGALERTGRLARAAGVDDLEWLDAAGVAALEPALHATAGLRSPSTGIVDSHALMLALLGEAEAHGAELILQAPVQRGAILGDGRIELSAGPSGEVRLRVAHLINCAGLWAQEVARRIEGLPAAAIPAQVLAKGSYFALSGRAPFRHLVYPAPPGDGSLGVHLTLDLSGRARFGPDIEILDAEGPDAVDYSVPADRAPVFEAAVRRYWPGLPEAALHPDYAGCRPKLADGDAGGVDFRLDGGSVHGLEGHVMCYGLESPALTAALALAEEIAARAGLAAAPVPGLGA